MRNDSKIWMVSSRLGVRHWSSHEGGSIRPAEVKGHHLSETDRSRLLSDYRGRAVGDHEHPLQVSITEIAPLSPYESLWEDKDEEYLKQAIPVPQIW